MNIRRVGYVALTVGLMMVVVAISFFFTIEDAKRHDFHICEDERVIELIREGYTVDASQILAAIDCQDLLP